MPPYVLEALLYSIITNAARRISVNIDSTAQRVYQHLFKALRYILSLRRSISAGTRRLLRSPWSTSPDTQHIPTPIQLPRLSLLMERLEYLGFYVQYQNEDYGDSRSLSLKLGAELRSPRESTQKTCQDASVLSDSDASSYEAYSVV